jgi:parallel beta-helix repeat protein
MTGFIGLLLMVNSLLSRYVVVVNTPGTVITHQTFTSAINHQAEWMCLYSDCQNAGQPDRMGGFLYGGTILVLADNVTIEDNTISGGVIGIAAVGVKNLTIRGNHISNQSGWGVYLFGVSDSTVENNTMDDVLRSCKESPDGCESAGILGIRLSGVSFAGNECSRGGDCYYINGESGRSQDLVFKNNICQAAFHNCFEITFADRVVMESNIARGDGRLECFYPFWVGGSVVSMSQNHWACIKGEQKALQEARDSTPVPTVVTNR